MKAKIISQLVLGIVFTFVQPIHSQNILTGGDFSTTTVITPYNPGVGPSNVWCSWQNGGTEATAAIVSGVCTYQVTNAGYSTWELQLVQGGFPLIQGDNYRLTFDVKADADRTFGVYLGEDGGSWTTLIGYDNYSHNTTTNWQTIAIDFNPFSVFAYHKLSFEVGGINTSIYFDNVTLVDHGSEPMVGILGTSVNGWNVDVDMATADGITYTLSNYPLTAGAVKFRQNNNWTVNWGGTTFPTGIGFQNGQDIAIVSHSNYDITFNRETGEYSFVCVSNCHAGIGILGTAVSPDNNRDSDVNMTTDDGIIYTLTGYTFVDGAAKFRQDDSWTINWGDYTFPTGYGYEAGPNIPVSAGNYNITFNRITGEYSFTATNCPVAGIQCPSDVYIANSPGMCGAYVTYPDVVAASNCGGEGITISQTSGLPSGSLFPIGITTNIFMLTNSSGNTASCSFKVNVSDTEPPVINDINIFPKLLWPPNHKMVLVTVKYRSSDNCSSKITSQLSVSCNETIEGQVDKNDCPDWKVLDKHHVLLRAERERNGTGREYYILIMSQDKSMNVAYQQVIVKVPHDLKMDKTNPGCNDKEVKTDSKVTPLIAKIWPNPGSQYFNLEVMTSSDENIELYLYDINGNQISNMKVLDKQSFRFGDDLKPGIYLAAVRQGVYFTTIKVIKQ